VLPQFEILLEHLEVARQRYLPLDCRPSLPSQPSQQPRQQRSPELSQRSQTRLRRKQYAPQSQQTDDLAELEASQSQQTPQPPSAETELDQPQYLTAEHHFSTNVNAGWRKLNDYYLRLDDNIIYVAAVALHPRLKWRYFKTKWSDRKDWLNKWKTELELYWYRYKDKASQEQSPRAASKCKDKHAADEWSDGEETDALDQLEQYLAELPDRTFSAADSPILYWQARKKMWPQLAQLALDIYSVPAMADAPERLFSQTGDILSPRRRQITSDHIKFIMCLRSWIDQGLITLDKSTFQRAIQALDLDL